MLENLPLPRYFNPSSVLWEVSMDIFWNCTITWGSYMYVSFIIMYFGQTCFKCQGNNHYAKMCLDSQGSKPSETTSCEANRLTKNQGHSDKHSHPTTLQYQQASHHKRWRLSEQVACFRKACNLFIKITDQCRNTDWHRKGAFSHSIHMQKIPSTCVQIGGYSRKWAQTS